MVTRVRTIDFLPEIFKTKTNEQFLNATLDQLVQQPNTSKVQGYIGSKFGYGVDTKDKYVTEATKDRNNYQLEPAVIFRKTGTNEALDFLTYPGMMDALINEGGSIKDQSKLFTNEFYSWDSFVDLDKVVNFGQYYWLPNGPESVLITNSNTYRNVAFNVTSGTNVYDVTADTVAMNTSNPTITLMRGGTYTFTVKQDSPFYIQGEPGISGKDPARPNINTRDIFGIDKNGVTDGTITFKVPLSSDQDPLNFPGNVEIDLVTKLKFSDIHGKRLDDLKSIDGITSLENKTLLFYGAAPDDIGFLDTSLYDSAAFEDADTFNADQYEEGTYSYIASNVYKINYLGTGADTVITLSEYSPIPNNQKITVLYGTEYIQRNFVKPSYGVLLLIPYISAPINTLYYQDGTNPEKFGKIKLLEEASNDVINIVDDIIGKKTYTSPNGVTLTNGLKINFSGYIVPESYKTGSYYVEGVGSSINLIPVTELLVAEPFSQSYYVPYENKAFDIDAYGSGLFVPQDKDYITINRGSTDRNAWSRSNRWFHHDVLETTIKFTPNSPASQAALNNNVARANRPIIEFYPDLKLFDHGVGYKSPIDYIDFTTTDAFADVSGQHTYLPDGDSTSIFDGARIVFANDNNPEVRNKIYVVSNSVVVDGDPTTITLSKATDGDVLYNEQLIVTKGAYGSGKAFYYNGTSWILGQQKVQVNQPPLFDLIDSNGISFGDQTYYVGSDFAGCTLFTYATGTGTDDPVLGIPLKYSSVNNIGDISFDVTLNTQTFNFLEGQTSMTMPVNLGYVYRYLSTTEYNRLIGWQTAVGPSFQYQIFDFGVNSYGTLNFVCDVAKNDASSTPWPTIVVYLDNARLSTSDYTVVTGTNITTVNIPTATTSSVVQVMLYSDQVSKTAYYDIPSNLDSNPFNSQIDTVNMGDLRGHFKSIYNNYMLITGSAFGPNNYRDLGNLVPYGTRIIQNSGTLVPMAMFLRNPDYNIFNSLSYNASEYVKFKSVLINSVDNGNYTSYDSPSSVLDDILDQLSAIKNESNSFFWSDMVPSKSPSTYNSYSFNTTTSSVSYPLSRIYDFTVANYFSVLIYKTVLVGGIITETQLVRDVDYVVSATEPKVTINISLVPGDNIVIKEYTQTYGSFVPNTPSKIGLYPKFEPEIETYTSGYLTPVSFIVGHDGSYTKMYGEYVDGQLVDLRDKVLFEFEKRVYNNIKVTAKIPLTREDIFPGYFRDTTYSYNEVLNMYSTQFLNWVGQNNIDFKSQYYSPTDNFTWNYNFSFDKLNRTPVLMGNWRGVYLWLYDTHSPDTTPWEMIGYSSKPSWWESRYGVTPYTSDNTLLWSDLEKGYDYNDGNPVIKPQFARPGLSRCLPVNSRGELLSPADSFVGESDPDTHQRAWKVGDVGPAEFSYLKSSSWPFDLMRIFALAQPAKFFTQGIDLDVFKYNDEFKQFLVYDRLRASPKDLRFYGGGSGQTAEVINTFAQHSYANWIIDYVQQFGVDGSSLITNLFQTSDVSLVYRLAGFTDKNMIKFYVEKGSPNSKNNSLLIPDESYNILLYKNQPFDRVIYSSIIVQKTEKGYAVYGNSQNKATFLSFTPKFAGSYDTITINNLSIKLSKDFDTTITQIPYGHEFTTIQGLCEFIMNYGRYLEQQGMIFDAVENALIVNWRQMVAELLYWIQSGWEIGSTVNINPAAKSLAFNKESTIIQPLTMVHQNYILNQNLIPIPMKDLSVYRNGSEFRVVPLNPGDTVGYFVADVSNIEHAIVFDNSTVFNDRIFNLVTGLRQQRLMVRGLKTAEWNGTMDAQGFIFNQDNILDWQANTKYTKGMIVKHKNSYWTANSMIQPNVDFTAQDWIKTDFEKIQKGLLPNGSNRAYESTLYYDSNRNNIVSDADLLSFSIVGYRPRDYLEQANINNMSQFNLFKNMISTKGTSNSTNMLNGASLPQGDVNYSIYENWAIKSAEFGGTLNQNFIEFPLDKHKVTGNPFIVGLTASDALAGVHQQSQLYSLTNYGRNITSSNILPTVTDFSKDTEILKTAGYVNFNDVRLTTYNFTGLTSADIGSLYKNDYIWVANYKNDWDVYSPVAIKNGNDVVNLVQVNNNLDGTSSLVFSSHHGLSADDLFGVVHFSDKVDNFYIVQSVIDLNTVVVSLILDVSIQSLVGTGLAFKLQSHRLLTPSDIYYLPLLDNEFFKNKVWVDYGIDGNWVVYKKSINYSGLGMNQTFNTSSFGSSAVYDPGLGYYISDSLQHKVYRIEVDTATGATTKLDTILPLFGQVDPYTFGTSMVIQGDILIISQPDNFGTNSYIWIFRLVNEGHVQRAVYQQYIWVTGGGIGETLCLSGDTNYLYASAKYYGGVTVFQKKTLPFIDTTGLTLAVDIVAGQTYFIVSGNHIADLPNGEMVTFAYDEYATQYMIVTSQYASGDDVTTFYISGNIDSDVPTGNSVYTASINYEYVGAFGAGLDSTAAFGDTLATDYTGKMVFVGAPGYSYSESQNNTGIVFVWERLVESWEAVADSNVDELSVFLVSWNASSTAQVSINGVKLDPSYYFIVPIDSTLCAVVIGPGVRAGDKITVSSANFVEKQVLSAYDDAAGVRSGAKFSKGMDCNITGCDLVVGAPFYINDDATEGNVYRFINEGKKYGVITGLIPVTIDYATDVLINEYRVSIPAGNASVVAQAINNAAINNVIAFATSEDDQGKLVIGLRDNTLGPVNNKLTLTVFNGNDLYYLGISEYTKTEILNNPHGDTGSQYGYTVRFNEQNSFVVSAPAGNRFESTFIDFSDDENNHNDTVFDNNFTQFVDNFPAAGAVYMYDYLTGYNENLLNSGKYVYAQSLNDVNTDYGVSPMYGTSLFFRHNKVVIGTPNFKVGSEHAGRVVVFDNSTNAPDWKVYRTSNPVVDINKIQKVQLYDNVTNTMIESLDYIDPVQGKILGAARENIDYLLSSDPADYNNGSAKGSIVWGKEHVGSIWFDTSNTKFINYHQDDIAYDSQYWGKIFPGSSVTVYSWVESETTPAYYAGTGTPYDLEKYSTSFEIDSNHSLVNRYYFWVRNTNKVFANKTLSDSIIEQYIRDPQSSGIPYFSPLSSNIYGLNNVGDLITSSSSLYLGFSTTNLENTSHSEFKLIRDGHEEDFLPGFPSANNNYAEPTSLYLKLLDSLSGLDSQGFLVPDPNLPFMVRIGISNRPNQSLFVNRLKALENYLIYANNILAQYPMAEFKQSVRLSLVGDTYDTTAYWSYVNWWADGYSDSTKPVYEVDKYYQLSSITSPAKNLIVGVRANSNGRKETYIYTGSAWERIGLQNGTIKFSSVLWDYANNGLGSGNNFFDADTFDTYPSTETRNIIRALNEEIYIGELLTYRNKSLILMFEYIQSENIEGHNYLPWLNKTSFIDVANTVRELLPLPKYQKDDDMLVEGFINETKPYHVVIKDFYMRYTGMELYASGTTDFDLPGVFNTETEKFYSPQLVLESTLEDQYLPTDPIWQQKQNINWFENYGLTVSGSSNQVIAILNKYTNVTDNALHVDNAYGLPVQGLIQIDNELIGYTNVDRINGILTGLSRGISGTTIAIHYPGALIYSELPGVIVVNSGRAYIDPPQVKAIVDTTKYPAPRRMAQLTAIMSGEHVIGIKVDDPGDGYVVDPAIYIEPSLTTTFNESMMNFQDNTIAVATDLLVSGDLVRFAVLPNSESGIELAGQNTLNGLIPGSFYYVRVVATLNSLSLADQAIYGSGPRTLITLHSRLSDVPLGNNPVNMYWNESEAEEALEDPTVMEYALELAAKATVVTKNSRVREITTKLKYDRTSYGSTIAQWTPGEFWPSPFNSLGNDASSDTNLSSPEAEQADASWQGSVLWITGKTDDQGTAVVTVDYSHSNGLHPAQIKGLKVYFYKVFDYYLYDASEAIFTASISGTSMTVTDVTTGALAVGQLITGGGLPAGTRITSMGTAKGGLGVYQLSVSATIASTMFEGTGGAVLKIFRPRFDPLGLSNQYYVVVVDPGSIYDDGDKIVIPGSLLGGVDGLNNCTVNIIFTNQSVITLYEVSGISVGRFAIYYVKPISDTQLKVFSDVGLKIPVLYNAFDYIDGDYAFVPEPFAYGATFKYVVSAVVVYEKQVYRCIASNSDLVFDPNKWTPVSSDDRSLNALDRVISFYNPENDMPGNNILSLVQGTTYPNTVYRGNSFALADALPLDFEVRDAPFYPRDINIKAMSFDGKYYVAAADTSDHSVILFSLDGLNWNPYKISNKVLGLTGITTTNAPTYFISSVNTSTPIYMSFDRVNWETLGEFTPYDVIIFGASGFDSSGIQIPNDPLYAVEYLNESYFAVGSEILRSDNGMAWHTAFSFGSRLTNVVKSITYVEAAYFAGYVAVGYGQRVINGNESAVPLIADVGHIITSIDNTTWQLVLPAFTDKQLHTVVSSFNIIVVAGESGTIFTSVNGNNWSVASINVSAPYTIRDSIFANGKFVLVGDNGTILTTSDVSADDAFAGGVTFTKQLSTTTHNLNTITFAGSYYFAAGENGTILRSTDGVVWKDVSYIETTPPLYDIKGDDFSSGYGPEELVAGVIEDNLSLTVTTKPGTYWDNDEVPDILYGYTGYNMKTVSGDLSLSLTMNFDGLVMNPAQLSVFVVNKITGLSTRVYENIAVSATNEYTYTINWITKVVTFNKNVSDTEYVLIEVYEVGNGRQIARSNSQIMPLRVNEEYNTSEFLLPNKFVQIVRLFSVGEITFDPVIYHNGTRLEQYVDYTVNFSGNKTRILFNELYDPLVDYITYTLVDNTIVAETNENLVYGYTVPETEVFVYADSNIFTLSNYVGGDNPTNAIVEINGLRKVEGTSYTIDDVNGELTILDTLNTDDIVAITSFHDTKRQNLSTTTVDNLAVTPIYYVDKTTSVVVSSTRYPTITVTTTQAHGLTSGDLVRIDGLNGMESLNNTTHYAKVLSATKFELYEQVTEQSGDLIFFPPTSTSGLDNFISGGYVWLDSTSMEVVSNFTYTSGERTWVTVNGQRVDPTNLRFRNDTMLNIMAPITLGDEVIVTSMISTATPNETVFTVTVDQDDIGSVYRLENNTWLTQPLYLYEDVIHVNDARNLVSNITENVIVDQTASGLLVHLINSVNDMSGIIVYNKSSLTTLDKSQYSVRVIDARPTVLFSSGVAEGHELIITVQVGHILQVNGERIRFRNIDYATNTVSGLLRGIKGTGIIPVHNTYDRVYRINDGVKLDNTYYTKVWNSSNATTSGDPLQISTTPSARFLNTGIY